MKKEYDFAKAKKVHRRPSSKTGTSRLPIQKTLNKKKAPKILPKGFLF